VQRELSDTGEVERDGTMGDAEEKNWGLATSPPRVAIGTTGTGC